MSEKQTRSNRNLQPAPSKKLNSWLNVLIGVVAVLIVITTLYIFNWQDNIEDTAKEDSVVTKPEEKEEEPSKEDSIKIEEEPPVQEEQQPEQETAVETPSDDPIVNRAITDANWQPTPTTQTGEHVSSYDDQSIDWAEKVATVTGVTGIEENNMIIWHLGNNGGVNKSIAIVSTKDKTAMYRVSMEWVNNEGWLPVKFEELNTVAGAY